MSTIPLHITYEYDDGIHGLELDGTPATIVTDPAAVPASGEIVVDVSGRLVFNAAEVGKTVTGTYRYALTNKIKSNS